MQGDSGDIAGNTPLKVHIYTAFPKNPSHIALRLFVPTTRQAGDAMRTQTAATGTAQARKCVRSSDTISATPTRADSAMAVRMTALGWASI